MMVVVSFLGPHSAAENWRCDCGVVGRGTGEKQQEHDAGVELIQFSANEANLRWPQGPVKSFGYYFVCTAPELTGTLEASRKNNAGHRQAGGLLRQVE